MGTADFLELYPENSYGLPMRNESPKTSMAKSALRGPGQVAFSAVRLKSCADPGGASVQPEAR